MSKTDKSRNDTFERVAIKHPKRMGSQIPIDDGFRIIASTFRNNSSIIIELM